jgi:hypothetical protein
MMLFLPVIHSILFHPTPTKILLTENGCIASRPMLIAILTGINHALLQKVLNKDMSFIMRIPSVPLLRLLLSDLSSRSQMSRGGLNKEGVSTWCSARGGLHETLLCFESSATPDYVCKLDKGLYGLR